MAKLIDKMKHFTAAAAILDEKKSCTKVALASVFDEVLAEALEAWYRSFSKICYQYFVDMTSDMNNEFTK